MLRILTLNAGLTEIRLLGIPFYTDVPHVRERAKHLAAALRAVAADIVALQELIPARVKKRLAAELSDLYPHAAGIVEDGRMHGAGLLTLSRFPIEARSYKAFARQTAEEGLFGPRGIVDCTVRTPSLGRCRVANLHATAGGAYWRRRRRGAQDCRHAQIAEAASIFDQADDGVVILAGDFNSGPTVAPHIYRCVIEAGFIDAVAAAPGASEPRGTWDPTNRLNRMKSVADAHRVDHVFVRGRNAVRVAGTRIVLDEPVVALSGRVTVPVSDHYGLLVELAAASGG